MGRPSVINHKGPLNVEEEVEKSAPKWCRMRKAQPAIAGSEDARGQAKKSEQPLEIVKEEEINFPQELSEWMQSCWYLDPV